MTATTTAPDCERPGYWHDAVRLVLDALARRAGDGWPAAYAAFYRDVAGPRGERFIAGLVRDLLESQAAGKVSSCPNCRRCWAAARMALTLNPRARAALRIAVLLRIEGSVAS